jgi:hypothetical protein
MTKPCDTKEYRDRLPCLALDGKTCYGRQYWDRARGLDPKQISHMAECPWIEKVREYWRRKGYGK